MPDYSKGKIYTIRFIDDDNHIYIGSTCQALAVRFGGHKITVSNLYKYIQDIYNGDWSKCYIELYEEFKADNKEQLNKREGEIIREFIKNDKYIVINKRIEGRTQTEYYQDNKEKLKEYLEKNKDKIKETRRRSYEKSKTNGTLKEYLEKSKDKIKEYRENNKEKQKQYHKEYRRDKERETERKKDYRERCRIADFIKYFQSL